MARERRRNSPGRDRESGSAALGNDAKGCNLVR